MLCYIDTLYTMFFLLIIINPDYAMKDIIMVIMIVLLISFAIIKRYLYRRN